jgi:hypothetical protein
MKNYMQRSRSHQARDSPQNPDPKIELIPKALKIATLTLETHQSRSSYYRQIQGYLPNFKSERGTQSWMEFEVA